jgi:hypothetical protein
MDAGCKGKYAQGPHDGCFAFWNPKEIRMRKSEAAVQMADTPVVGLHSWIIQDGNYGDFARDMNAAFALEFYASSPLEMLESNHTLAPALIRVRDADYKVVG